MNGIPTRSLLFAGLLAGATVQAQIPKPVDAPGPLTPEQTAASYRLPPGFRLDVVASEPLIAGWVTFSFAAARVTLRSVSRTSRATSRFRSRRR